MNESQNEKESLARKNFIRRLRLQANISETSLLRERNMFVRKYELAKDASWAEIDNFIMETDRKSIIRSEGLPADATWDDINRHDEEKIRKIKNREAPEVEKEWDFYASDPFIPERIKEQFRKNAIRERERFKKQEKKDDLEYAREREEDGRRFFIRTLKFSPKIPRKKLLEKRDEFIREKGLPANSSWGDIYDFLLAENRKRMNLEEGLPENASFSDLMEHTNRKILEQRARESGFSSYEEMQRHHDEEDRKKMANFEGLDKEASWEEIHDKTMTRTKAALKKGLPMNATWEQINQTGQEKDEKEK